MLTNTAYFFFATFMAVYYLHHIVNEIIHQYAAFVTYNRLELLRTCRLTSNYSIKKYTDKYIFKIVSYDDKF